jgi:AcrR family transcriptional regulator
MLDVLSKEGYAARVQAQEQIDRARSGRGRRSPQAGGDEREQAILRTAELLLAERPLAEISVDDLARGAGLSRSAFYFYFPSKDAVVLTLVDRVVAEGDLARDTAFARHPDEPVAAWRDAIESLYRVYGAHRPMIRAVTDLGTTNEEALALWSQVMEGWVEFATRLIEAERAHLGAPREVPARALAIALVQMNERVMRASFIDEQPALEGQQMIDTLTHIWRSAVYTAPVSEDT